MELGKAWEGLDARFRVCLEQAWASLVRRGLPVGAVVAMGDAIVAVGRNRVYDDPGGSDALQRTPIAHAEMNALAGLRSDLDPADCSMWSTHVPCAMCEAAIGFTGLESSHYLARDPSAPDQGPVQPLNATEASVWAVVANLMFLHNVAWVGGRDNRILASGVHKEPVAASLAMRVLDERTFIEASEGGADLMDALSATWTSIVEATTSSEARG